MLISPPAPPKPSMTKDSAAPSMTGLSQGSAFSHPSTPLPARQPSIDRVAQSKRHGNDLEQQFERRADRGPPPQVGAGDRGEHHEGNRRAGIVPLPAVQIHRH